MASKINADEFVDREGEGKPTLPKGVVLSGVTTITTAVVAENEVANSTGINAGIITSTHFAGNLTGDVNAGIVTVTSQTVVGSAVTISASGIDIGAGVITATSYAGSGANLTGIGATIMIWEYNPDPSDMSVPFATGIGITFNQRIKAGSGNITLREDSASGTVVENFGIGSSVTISNNELTISPTSNLSESQVYHLSYPSGVITNMAGESYVGTAYTFKSMAYNYDAYIWGENDKGQLGLNNTTSYSSPVQLPGTTWKNIVTARHMTAAVKTDGTLWSWGYNDYGALGQGQASPVKISSPVQVGSGTNWKADTLRLAYDSGMCCKTDGTLWSWGYGSSGRLGNNTDDTSPSPVEIYGGGTTWDKTFRSALRSAAAIKTDGTLWVWGEGADGVLGLNSQTQYSSPVQLGSDTTWASGSGSYMNMFATKTDGTLWAWGSGRYGNLGQNTFGPGEHGDGGTRSSPIQIPGTTWSNTHIGITYHGAAGLKTDGTFWAWGKNEYGQLGQNNTTQYSSPAQIAGTTWDSTVATEDTTFAIKTDGTLWSWGSNEYGQLDAGLAHDAHRSSPVQIGSETDWFADGWSSGAQGTYHIAAIRRS